MENVPSATALELVTDCKLDVGIAYLSVIRLARSEQGLQRVVSREDEAGGVDEELAGNVEENEQEVEGTQAEHNVDFGNGGLGLEVIEDLVLRQLSGRVS